jgi:NAD(P)-dependent dehydrogenase (short-subunit alcohol dehydrogenase family)
MKLAGKTAIVTGAASGIGRAIAISLSRRGCHLALADLNEIGLAETAALAAAPGLRITRHRLDVADKDAIAAFPDIVLTSHQGADLLVNNAGVALGGNFEQVSEEDFEWLFAINFWGVVRMTRAFLPLLKDSSEARIVNISSLFGLIAPPGQAAYCASKFAVRGFSESLRHELEGSRIGVTVVHPGGIATNIAKNARIADSMPAEDRAKMERTFRRLLSIPPEKAGALIVQAIEHRRPRLLIGATAKLAALLERLAPVSYWRLLRMR